MIRNFKHRGLKRFFERGDDGQIGAQRREKIRRILVILDRIKTLDELAVPAFRLHRLVGDLKGFWSLSVSPNWRIIFRFKNEGVYDVDLIDYH